MTKYLTFKRTGKLNLNWSALRSPIINTSSKSSSLMKFELSFTFGCNSWSDIRDESSQQRCTLKMMKECNIVCTLKPVIPIVNITGKKLIVSFVFQNTANPCRPSAVWRSTECCWCMTGYCALFSQIIKFVCTKLGQWNFLKKNHITFL